MLDNDTCSAHGDTCICDDDHKYWTKESSKEYSCIADEAAIERRKGYDNIKRACNAVTHKSLLVLDSVM